MDPKSAALFQSLKSSPMLVSSLPEAALFDRRLLEGPSTDHALNFDQKLGHLYEDALEHLIVQSLDLDLIDSHVQIFDGKRTVGELDFLLFDKQAGTYIHLELAVKFYLALEKEDGWHYPGPDQRDNWDRKINHMLSHQLVLAQSANARAYLREQYGIASLTTQHLIYGCLFVPAQCAEPPRPAYMDDERRRGLWLRPEQLGAFFTEDDVFYHIPKALWPAEVSDEMFEIYEPLSKAALFKAAAERCVMFSTKDSQQPWFLVPDDWGR